MKQNKIMMISVVWVLLGMSLIGLSFAEIVDSFWSGMGSALLVVGVLRLFRYYRFRKNPNYREKLEIEASDERLHYIRNKAWAWAGYLFVLTMSVAIIVLRIIGQDLLSTAASMVVCFMLLLFWGAYHVLSRKY